MSRHKYKIMLFVCSDNVVAKMIIVNAKNSYQRSIDSLIENDYYIWNNLASVYSITCHSVKQFPALSKQVNDLLSMADRMGKDVVYTTLYHEVEDKLYSLYVG